tara:strand:+ start:7141 stop:7401 length:261 start_codon:yes stop_codon:yes gene_type:complete
MVTREEAKKIAQTEMKKSWPKYELIRVITLEEVDSAPPHVFNDDLSNCWIAYLLPVEIVGLFSSTIIVIDRDTGEIRYQGSASDEG